MRRSRIARDSPCCRYQAIGANALDSSQRGAAINTYPYARRVLAVTEGLLAYLHPNQVEALAEDLHRQSACRWWLTDLVGPNVQSALRDFLPPSVPTLNFQFAPTDSALFIASLGWRELAFNSAADEASRLNRSGRILAPPRLGMILSSPGLREEFRRAAGVVSLVRQVTR